MTHQRLQSYLDTHKIPYQVVNHSIAYTAREAADSLHIPADTFAKSSWSKPIVVI